MSRTVSDRALAAFFAPECAEQAIILLRISGANLAEPIYLCDGYVKRLVAYTDDDQVVYGVTSESIDHLFMPFEMTLPNDAAEAGPGCELTIHNATRLIMPQIRSLTGVPTVRLQIVLRGATEADNGETVTLPEIEIDGLELRGIRYNADTVTGSLVIESMASEPFPAHTMTPGAFPGLF